MLYFTCVCMRVCLWYLKKILESYGFCCWLLLWYLFLSVRQVGFTPTIWSLFEIKGMPIHWSILSQFIDQYPFTVIKVKSHQSKTQLWLLWSNQEMSIVGLFLVIGGVGRYWRVENWDIITNLAVALLTYLTYAYSAVSHNLDDLYRTKVTMNFTSGIKLKWRLSKH